MRMLWSGLDWVGRWQTAAALASTGAVSGVIGGALAWWRGATADEMFVVALFAFLAGALAPLVYWEWRAKWFARKAAKRLGPIYSEITSGHFILAKSEIAIAFDLSRPPLDHQYFDYVVEWAPKGAIRGELVMGKLHFSRTFAGTAPVHVYYSVLEVIPKGAHRSTP